ncbi:MAG: hypothetical protein K2M76_02140, partial [Muribaculaceae bacterium]|nr:hypothetical protein [Muribaculaceae bacterium]
MKKIFVAATMAAMISMSAFCAEPETVDTLTVVECARSVVITNEGNQTRVEILGTKKDPAFRYELDMDVQSRQNGKVNDDWNLKLPFFADNQDETKHGKKTRRKKWKYTCMQHFYIGFNTPQNAPYGFARSAECGLLSFAGIAWKPVRHGPEFSMGIGFSEREMNLHHGKIWGKEKDRLTVTAAPEGAKKAKGDLFSLSFVMPLLVSQKIAGDFGLTAGALVNFNTYAKATSEYCLDGVTTRSKYK